MEVGKMPRHHAVHACGMTIMALYDPFMSGILVVTVSWLITLELPASGRCIGVNTPEPHWKSKGRGYFKGVILHNCILSSEMTKYTKKFHELFMSWGVTISCLILLH